MNDVAGREYVRVRSRLQAVVGLDKTLVVDRKSRLAQPAGRARAGNQENLVERQPVAITQFELLVGHPDCGGVEMNLNPASFEDAVESARDARGKGRHDPRAIAHQVELQLFILASILPQQGLQAELNRQQ